MANIHFPKQDELIDEFIEQSENEDEGIWASFKSLIRKIFAYNFIRGFFAGIGIFCGHLV